MKNGKKNFAQKISELGIVLVILVGMFAYFKYKWNTKKIIATPVVTTVAPEINEPPPSDDQNATEPQAEVPPVQTEVKVTHEEIISTQQKKLDPLLVKITNFSAAINEKFELKLRTMFKSEGNEEYMDKYLALRLERTIRMRELLKTNNSRAANLNVNYEYHNKLFAIIGKELYVKYLKILKETNDDAQKTKIVFEF